MIMIIGGRARDAAYCRRHEKTSNGHSNSNGSNSKTVIVVIVK